MSVEATYVPTIEEAIFDGLQELLDAPFDSTHEIDEEERRPSRKKRKRRKGENVRPTALQLRYQRQVRDSRLNKPELIESMSKMVAWTWIPGKDRRQCPPIVDIRNPRLIVMDRFPAEPGGQATQIGLAMYRSTISNKGVVTYGAPNVEMFKDFSIRPHFRAGGLCLDSRNEEVFRTALELDRAMELVALGKLEPVTDFVPPQCLFGFPKHYLPSPEWRAPMQKAVLEALHPDSAPLRCLLSPGGLVVEVLDTRDGFRTISIEKEGNMIQVRVPSWIKLDDAVHKGGVVLEGQPLGDLPRGVFTCIKDVTQRYPFRSLEWLERRILDEHTEIISVQEEVFDKQTRTRVPSTTIWRCVPSQFVQNQMGRAVRFFLDMRQHLGRRSWTIDSFERDMYSDDPHQVRIDVRVFDTRPTVKDLQFCGGDDEKSRMWFADLLSAPDGAAWAPRCPLRGVVA